MSGAGAPLGHARGQTPAVSGRARSRLFMRVRQFDRRAGHDRLGQVWGQTPAVARRDA